MRALLAVSVLLVSAVLLEVGVRTITPVPYAGLIPRFVAHPHLVYVGNPLHEAINSAGFGDVERAIDAEPGTLRIAALGGSTTFGVGSWPTMLQDRFGEAAIAPRVEVLNFGMDGWTTQESLINLAVNVIDYHPDIVVIHHALNDLMPRLYREPKRDYSHFRKAFSYNPGPIARRSHLYLFVRERLVGVPSLANTGMTVNDDNPENPYVPGRLSGDGGVFARNLRTMIGIAEGAGAAVVLTTMPYSLDPKKLPVQWTIEHATEVEGMVQHNQIIRELASARGLPLVDLDAEMTGVERYFVDHVHCNSGGNLRKAELIAASARVTALLEAAKSHL